MLLIYLNKTTSRTDYIFKHICSRILGLTIGFTNSVEDFVAHNGPKFSYGRQPLGGEFFIQSHGLLFEQGFEDVPVTVKPWRSTVCFFSVDRKSSLPFDIFSASFYLMSRYEEYLPHMQDDHGRFPASASLGYREGFLRRPVVDIWAHYFLEAFMESFPKLKHESKSFRIHNLIDASVPFAYAQRGPLRSVIGMLNDLFRFRFLSVYQRFRVFLRLTPDPYDTFDFILDQANSDRSSLTVFFLLGEAEHFRDSYNSRRKKIRMLIKHVADYAGVGLVFSVDAIKQPEKMKPEKRRMEDLVLRELQFTTLSDYRLSLPDGYRNLVELEVERDFTLVYPDELGFRAGTCTPFLFYDLDYEITSPLEIHPIAATTVALARLKRQEIFDTVAELIQEVKLVNGTFSMFFRNKDFVPKFKNRVWNTLYSETLQSHKDE